MADPQQRSRSRTWIGLIAALVLVEALTLNAPPGNAVAARPNIVLILTDDQRWDELSRMPKVRSLLLRNGVDFRKAFALNPLCCPSRSTILTGLDSSHDGVWNNAPPYGGFQTFTALGDDRSTIGTWLQSAGYRTALVGKYLNGYYPGNVGYVPPGWNTWDVLALRNTPTGEQEGGYYNYAMSVNGRLVFHGSSPADYSTNVLSGIARRFIASTPPAQPLFLYFAPRAPHQPATAAQRDKGTCRSLPPNRPPNYNETDVADKPPYVRRFPVWKTTTIRSWDTFHVKQCRSLQAVDDAVASIVHSLAAVGRLSNTLIVFMSDNGLADGEHRWAGKTVPYEESIRIPMIVRFDPVTGGRTSSDGHLVTNLDIAPTFLDAAGITQPTQGQSLLPLLDGTASTWPTNFLIEHGGNTHTIPAYCGIRGEQYVYVRYADGFEELYDLNADPYEQHNLLHRSDPGPGVEAVRDRLLSRTMALCNPRPPGYTF